MGVSQVKDVYCVGTGDFVLWLDAALTWGEVEINGVADMVAKVPMQLGKEQRLGTLTIVGHGNAVGQYVGGDWISDMTVNGHAVSLQKLAPLFDKAKGRVVLGGCQVGAASVLMCRLSDIFGIPVVGFTANQRPALPGDEGAEATCRHKVYTRGESTFMDWIDGTSGGSGHTITFP